ncbi:hypothetical protein N656DRAFT_454668 [Canariomyces notabilis]|uniref:Uncharacterized protein n=1 Tax=Canariomyces notabilis TaxID=2074819 RepID=A0AAN6T8F7_9PEZI|nr:hypothetical protein N656DRAFT_454668 [Canariomyces arenarius]
MYEISMQDFLTDRAKAARSPSPNDEAPAHPLLRPTAGCPKWQGCPRGCGRVMDGALREMPAMVDTYNASTLSFFLHLGCPLLSLQSDSHPKRKALVPASAAEDESTWTKEFSTVPAVLRTYTHAHIRVETIDTANPSDLRWPQPRLFPSGLAFLRPTSLEYLTSAIAERLVLGLHHLTLPPGLLLFRYSL